MIELKQKIDDMAEDVREIKRAVSGDPLVAGSGLIARIDRIEQVEKRRVWIFRTAIVAAIASCFDFFAHHITRNP